MIGQIFLRLISCLIKGNAYELVSELTITDSNYDVALRILKENFEDKDLIF